jgi:hypothetical protein
MSSWAVLATTAGSVTIGASATAIVTLAAAVRARSAAARSQAKLEREVVSRVARETLGSSAALEVRARAHRRARVKDRRDISPTAEESELLSLRLRSMARDLEAEADSIAVDIRAVEDGSPDTAPGPSTPDNS